jgi:ribosome assembly protein YihI (activator of Der GTPase)
MRSWQCRKLYQKRQWLRRVHEIRIWAARRSRSEKEARKHMQRRKKRKRDKASGGDAQQNGAAEPKAHAAGDDVMASDLLAPLQVTHRIVPNALQMSFLLMSTFSTRAPGLLHELS